MKRLNDRKWWLLFLFLFGVAALFLGKYWLFPEAKCPRLVDTLLNVVASVVVSIALIWAITTDNDSPAAIGLSIIGVGLLVLIIPFFSIPYLVNYPPLQIMFCPPRVCEQADFVRSLRNENSLDAAEEAARSCLSMASRTDAEANCKRECAADLVLVLYTKANPEDLPEDYFERQKLCKDKASRLQEAEQVAKEYNWQELTLLVQERHRRLQEACNVPTPTPTPTLVPTPTPMPTPTPTPTPTVTLTPTITPTPTPYVRIEVLRARYSPQDVVVDVRVVDLRTGSSVQGLLPNAFEVYREDRKIRFKLEERKADDPVCVIAVVDNSGSIQPGLTAIRQAILRLNDLRKPGDQLGMVVFSGHTDIAQYGPSGEPLDPGLITGSGQLTALWDAALTAIDLAQTCKYPYRYLILLTDGRDNDSQLLGGDNLSKSRAVEQRAVEANVSICSIGIKSEQLEPVPLEVAAYGCGYYEVENFDAVVNLFTNIFGYVRDFYRLHLDPKDVSIGSKIRIAVDNVEVPLEIGK